MSTNALKAAVDELSLDGGHELLMMCAPAASSKKRFVRSVPITDALGMALLALCQSTLDHLRMIRKRDFDPRGNPTAEEAQLIAAENLNLEADLFALLKTAGEDHPAGAHSDELKYPKLYAVAFGAGEQRFFFVRRRLEALAASGKLVLKFTGDQLAVEDKPVFVFPVDFEALLHPLGVVLLKGNVFESLFQSKEDVAKQVGANMTALIARVPLDEASHKPLVKACVSYAYLRKRLRSVIENPKFAKLTPPRILEVCAAESLDPATFFEGETIRLSEENVDRFLRFLNDEVYRGPFTNELLAADGVAPF